MKRKNLISLSVAFAFTCLGATGLLLYFGQKMKAVETIHSLFGVIFVGFAIFHIVNNWGSLVSYFKERTGGVRKEFMISGALFLILLVGTAFEFEPFVEMAHAGESLFRGDRRGSATRVIFEKIATNATVGVNPLTVVLQKQDDIRLPVVAIWVEDSLHQFVSALFVPAKTLTVYRGEEDNVDEAIAEGEVDEETFTASLLPRFNEKAKDAKPNYEATPNENFILETATTVNDKFYLNVEIKAGDKTELYTAFVDRARGDVFKLKSKEGTLLSRGLVAF
jgi:hypothetical protein